MKASLLAITIVALYSKIVVNASPTTKQGHKQTVGIRSKSSFVVFLIMIVIDSSVLQP